jgi:hypothetical protein
MYSNFPQEAHPASADNFSFEESMESRSSLPNDMMSYPTANHDTFTFLNDGNRNNFSDHYLGHFDSTEWLFDDAGPSAWPFPVVDGQPSGSPSTAIPEPPSEESYNCGSGGVVLDLALFPPTNQQLHEDPKPQPLEPNNRGGDILRQRPYQPQKSLEGPVPETIITFSMADGGGIPITDALEGNFEKLQGRDDPMFEDSGTAASIRFEVCRLPFVYR